ncbi:hypothetical protein KW95_01765 [Clostridioides difficile]|nr:hypothetical protein KW95_01765 [Clostridioides difficile]
MDAYTKKIVYGMDKIHVAKISEDGYVTPMAIVGAKDVEANFEIGDKTIYADNKGIYNNKKISKGSGKLGVIGLTTDEKCLLGGTENMSGGYALADNVIPPNLALLFAQDKADGGSLLTVIYNVQFNPVSIAAVTTEDSIEETKTELDFTALVGKDGYWYYTIDTTDSKVDADMISKFFTEVQLPKIKADSDI